MPECEVYDDAGKWRAKLTLFDGRTSVYTELYDTKGGAQAALQQAIFAFSSDKVGDFDEGYTCGFNADCDPPVSVRPLSPYVVGLIRGIVARYRAKAAQTQ